MQQAQQQSYRSAATVSRANAALAQPVCALSGPARRLTLDLSNSPRLQNLIRDGKIYISLRDAIALAIENNLDLAYFRYNFPIAQTDILRTKAGGTVQRRQHRHRPVGTQGGFAGCQPAAEAARPDPVSAGAGGIVTSTLGAGTAVSSFDPFLTFKGYVDHTVDPGGQPFLIRRSAF